MNNVIKKIWKRYNVSTILILPLFDEVSMDLPSSAFKGKHRFIFSHLCYEHGLINCYVHNRNDKYYLCIKFNKESVRSNLVLIVSSYRSLDELIIDRLKPYNIIENEDEILYYVNIDDKYQSDIKLITESKYSKTSKLYKKKLKSLVSKIIVTNNDIGIDIIELNLAHRICEKDGLLKKMIEESINIELNSDSEIFESFDPSKEYI